MSYIDVDFSFFSNNPNDAYFTLANALLGYRVERLLKTLTSPAISKEYQGKALIDTPQVKILTDGVNREALVLSPVIGFVMDKCPDNELPYQYYCSVAKAKGAMLLTRVKSAVISKDGASEDWLYTNIQDNYSSRISEKSFYFTNWMAQENKVIRNNYFPRVWKILNFFILNELEVKEDGVVIIKDGNKIFGFDRVNTSPEVISLLGKYFLGDKRYEFNEIFKDETTFKELFQRSKLFKPHPILSSFEFSYSLTKKDNYYTIAISYDKKFKDLNKLYYIKNKFYELAELGKEVITPIAFNFWDENYVRIEYTGGPKESITSIEFFPEQKIIVNSYNLLTGKATQKEIEFEDEYFSVLIKQNKIIICDKLDNDFEPNEVIYEIDNLPTLAVIPQNNQYLLRHGFKLIVSSLEDNHIYYPVFDKTFANLYNLTIDKNSKQKMPITMAYSIEKDSE